MRNTKANSLGNLPFQIDTSSRDYESIRSSLISYIDKIAPEWTDRSPADIGIVLLESMAYVADVLHYQLDRMQNESYLPTAQERRNVRNLLRLIDYELSTGTGSSVPVCIITNEDNVTIPALTQVTVEGETIGFELPNSVFLPNAGIYCPSSVKDIVEQTLELPVIVKEELVLSYGTTVVENVGVSDGSSYQSFVLERFPVSISSDASSNISITLSDGSVYSPVNNFLGSESDSKIFTYEVLSDERVKITFGDDISGEIPSINSEIVVSYRVGTGSITNSYGIGSLTRMTPTPIGVQSLFNPVQPSGGKDPESIRDAKINGPLSLRALDRAITLQDFEVLAAKTPGGGVKAARAVAEEPYDVTVYISAEGQNPIPTGIWYPSLDTGTGLIGAVGRWLNAKRPVATRLNVLAPTPVTPILSVEVTCNPNILRNEVILLVKESLLSMYEDISEHFGKGIPLSKVIQVIENTRGVDFLNVFEFRRDPSLYLIKGNNNEVVNASISVDNVMTTVKFAKYEIHWLNKSQFYLFSEGYGFIRDSYTSEGYVIFNSGDTNTIYWYNSNPNEEVSNRIRQFDLTITTGPVDPTSGTIWGFTTDNYVGNMALEPSEILVPPVSATGLLNSNFTQIITLGGI